jgi:hypothetical protein
MAGFLAAAGMAAFGAVMLGMIFSLEDNAALPAPLAAAVIFTPAEARGAVLQPSRLSRAA